MATEALSFGAFIRQRRNERGLTLLDVAGALEISIPYLSRIERDREKAPRDELIRDLAKPPPGAGGRCIRSGATATARPAGPSR